MTQTYETAKAELADIVKQLEQGGLTLDESINKWERGQELVVTCEGLLDNAKERIDVVIGVGE